MEQSAAWISRHALPLAAALLIAVSLGAGLAWRPRAPHADHQRTRGAQLAARALAALVMLLLFIVLAVGVQQHAGLVRFDIALAQQLHQALPLPALRIIASLTEVGDPKLLALAAAVVAGWLAVARHWRQLALWCFTLAGIVLLDESLKACFRRPRPLDGHGYMVASGWSFPSGHAAGSLVFYGLLAHLLLRQIEPGRQRLLIATAAMLVALTGLSRILLQVHYLSDVLAGYALAAAWLIACLSMAERWPPRATWRHGSR